MPLQKWERALVRKLETMRDKFPVEQHPGLCYRGPADFILRHGCWYLPRRADEKYRTGVPKHCFGNAIWAGAMYGLRYVEGYAVAHHPLDPGPPVVMAHGWNIDAKGQLVDLTWEYWEDATGGDNCYGLAYCGVEFSIERADVATWTNDACVLQDPKHNYPVLQQKWEGEDYSLQWETTELLRLVKAQAPQEQISKWLEENWNVGR